MSYVSAGLVCAAPPAFHRGDVETAGRVELDFPFILGYENAGWIEAVGDGVEHVEAGDAAVCHVQMTCGVCIPAAVVMACIARTGSSLASRRRGRVRRRAQDQRPCR